MDRLSLADLHMSSKSSYSRSPKSKSTSKTRKNKHSLNKTRRERHQDLAKIIGHGDIKKSKKGGRRKRH
jgi:hypothetical protein